MKIYFHKICLYHNFSSYHEHNTRSANYLLSSFQSINLPQWSINYTGPLLWDNIPTHIRTSKSLSSFKSAHKKFSISGYPNQGLITSAYTHRSLALTVFRGACRDVGLRLDSPSSCCAVIIQLILTEHFYKNEKSRKSTSESCSLKK